MTIASDGGSAAGWTPALAFIVAAHGWVLAGGVILPQLVATCSQVVL
jgi:hypothetical protein